MEIEVFDVIVANLKTKNLHALSFSLFPFHTGDWTWGLCTKLYPQTY